MEQKSKYDVGNGIHRVPTWRIAGYALNNLATNMYMMMMMYIAYFITGWVGLGVVLAGSLSPTRSSVLWWTVPTESLERTARL